MPSLDRPIGRHLSDSIIHVTLATCALCVLAAAAGAAARAQEVPKYKVDPYWPKPLPHHWLMQGVPVMVVDKDDHIWVMNRPRDVNPDEIGSNSIRKAICFKAGEDRAMCRAGPQRAIRGLGPAPSTASSSTAKETSGFLAARAAIPS